jgi:hypothetical protein
MQQILEAYKNHIVDDKTQRRLNSPLRKGSGLHNKQADFMTKLIEKLDNEQIDPLHPATLFNYAVYDKLSEEDQDKTDLSAVNLMGIVKQIKVLWDLNHEQSFQLQNLVDTVFAMKSKFEEEYGDVFII